MKDSEKFPKLYPKLKKLVDGHYTPKLQREVLNLIQKDYKKLKNNKSNEDYDEQILNYLFFLYCEYTKLEDLTIKDQIVLAYLDYQYYFKAIGIFFDLDLEDAINRTDELPPRPKISKVALKIAMSGISKDPGFNKKVQARINLLISELQEIGARFV